MTGLGIAQRILILSFVFTVMSTSITGGVVTLVRGFPHKAHPQLIDFLSGVDTCAPDSCLMNIQPGITTPDQVDRLFRQNAWVDQFFYQRGMAVGSGMIQWTWSGEQPAFIDGARDGKMWIEDGVVYWIEIPSRLTLGELWFIYPPEIGASFTTSAHPPRLIYWGLAVEDKLQLRMTVACPSRVQQMWTTPVILRVGALESALINANTPLHPFSPHLKCPYA